MGDQFIVKTGIYILSWLTKINCVIISSLMANAYHKNKRNLITTWQWQPDLFLLEQESDSQRLTYPYYDQKGNAKVFFSEFRSY